MSIDLSGYKTPLLFAMCVKFKWNGKLMVDGCAETNFAAIGNGFVEVL